MYFVQYGGKGGTKYSLQESDSLIAVRTHSRDVALGAPQEAAPLSPASLAILSEFDPVAHFHVAGVEVFKARKERRTKSLRDTARRTLKKDVAVRFAGRVLVEPKSQAPVLYTENCFIKFQDDVKPSEIKRLLKKYNFKGKRMLGYARNAWFISAPEGIGLELFDLVSKFFKEDAVELLHPELIRRVAHKEAFVNQWHLKKTRIGTTDVNAHANVEAAWSLADGTGVTIAVIDDGVDLDHEEFRGSSKILAPRDVTLGTNHPR